LRRLDSTRWIKSEMALSKVIYIRSRAQAAHRQLALLQNSAPATSLLTWKTIVFLLCPVAPIELSTHSRPADQHNTLAQRTRRLISHASTRFSIIEECVTQRPPLYLAAQAETVNS